MNIQERRNDLLLAIAQENCLEYVETTIGSNGYPSHIEGAIIGFESFEQFSEIKSQYNLQSLYLTRREGNHLWNRGNVANIYTPFDVDADMFGEGYEIWYQWDSDRYKEYVLECVLDEFNEDLKKYNLNPKKMSLIDLLMGVERLNDSDEGILFDFNPIIKVLKNSVEILNAIEKLDSQEFGVLTNYNELYDAHLKLTTMHYCEDVYHNAIALK